MEREIAQKLSTSRGIYVVTSAELAAAYPVAEYADPHADALGHIPYRQEFFNALGTMIARRFYRIQTPPHKVLALDCDQTLWKGVCGEDGALGVNIDSACRALQEFVVAQRDAGILVCLCSKNNQADVWKVFRQNPGMLLKQEHIVASRINWQPKSENLRSLAEELQVGLDSFIFLDDNAIECAEVEARCPEVLTLQLPETEPERSKFLRHVWAFDHLKVTEEDRQRSDFYAQNAQRDVLRRRSLSLDEFLAGLDLQVEIRPLQEADVVRVAQLTQRTNQFNFTTIRRTDSEIEELVHSGAECLTVTLRDRFGEYGLVGVMIFQVHSDALETDTVLLSCRALGRRVEHRMLAHLGQIAQQRGIERVQLRFAPTEKNRPAREFLESLDAVLDNHHGHGLAWDVPASRLAELSPQSCAADGVRRRSTSAVAALPVPAEESDAGVRTE
jgi:FkbH-like protein